MLSFDKGRPIAKIEGGKLNGEIVHLQTDDNSQCCSKCSKKCLKKPCCGGCNMCYDSDDDNGEIGDEISIRDGKMVPIPNLEQRAVDYIAGPSGSGKSSYASNLIKIFKKVYPDKKFYVFSRTDTSDDPAFKGLKPIQVTIDESLVEDPIDITNELSGGCLVLFDDCNTIQDDKQKKAVDKLMADIMEVGRKLGIWIIITNHLVIPNEKKMARTVLNEMHSLTVFPKSGSTQQIRYCLKQYFGLNNKQIDEIISLPSRWVTINKNYPMCVLYDKGAYIL